MKSLFLAINLLNLMLIFIKKKINKLLTIQGSFNIWQLE